MHFREFVDSVQSIIAVAELVANDSKDGNATMADFLYALSNAGISMDYDKFKSVYDNNPELKNVIQQFDAETVTFVGGEPEADAPVGDIPPEEKVGQMAKRAMNKRESVEEGLPPHLAKMFDKYGNFKDPKKQAKFDAMQKKEREKKQMKWVDVTPKGYGPVEEATLEENYGMKIVGDLERIVDQKSAAEIKFFDGKAKVDMYTASAFMQVYNKVNDANKKKMAKMIETRPGFISLMKKIFNMTKPVKEGMEDKIKADIVAGMSTDAIIGKYANKRTTNTDEIRKMIQQIKWNMRKNNEDVQERSLTKAEKEKMKHYEKKLDKAEFKKRYGKDGEAVYYATATKMAKKNA